MTCIWTLKIVQMNSFRKQKKNHRCRKQTSGYQRGRVEERFLKKKGGGLPVGPVTKIPCCQCREINAEKFHVSFTQCLPLATSCKTILQL